MKKGLDSFTLKIIAITAMTIDHIGSVLYPDLIILRMIGRITFPIIAFLIAEGYFHTSNKNKYLLRMFIFALISQIPFMLAIGNNLNILFNLFFVLLILRIWETNKDKLIAIGLISLIIPFIFISDWSWIALALILAFKHFREDKLKIIYSLTIITGLVVLWYLFLGSLTWAIISFFMLLPIPFIYLYNGKKGKSLKYFFYIFYPAHLLILYLIKVFFF